jgi:hypothetical protein
VSNPTFRIKVISTWANGRPDPALLSTSPDWLEFIERINAPRGRISSPIWPDSNTVIRYCTNSAMVQEYVTALTNLCTFLDRNDWSYILENGSIPCQTGFYDQSTLIEWSTSWVPAV